MLEVQRGWFQAHIKGYMCCLDSSRWSRYGVDGSRHAWKAPGAAGTAWTAPGAHRMLQVQQGLHVCVEGSRRCIDGSR